MFHSLLVVGLFANSITPHVLHRFIREELYLKIRITLDLGDDLESSGKFNSMP